MSENEVSKDIGISPVQESEEQIDRDTESHTQIHTLMH